MYQKTSTKLCNSCKVEKPLEDFYFYTHPNNGRRYARPVCKPCHTENNNKYKSPERNRQYHLKHMYGITIAELDAMKIEQDNKCAICKKTSHNLNIDHDHETGRVRGLLCWNCNTALGKFYDDPALLLSAFSYLLEVE